MIYVLWTLNMIGYVAFTIGVEWDWKKREAKGPPIMCILSGSSLIGLVMWFGATGLEKLAILDRNVVTFVMLYFVLALANVLFLTIHAIRMIMQKDKGYEKAIASEGIIATTFFAYGAWMLRCISLR